MHKLKRILQKAVLYAVSIMLVGGMPMIAFAEDAPKYSYDSDSQRWNTEEWVYDPASGVYVQSKKNAPPPETPAPVANDTDGATASGGGDATVVDHDNASATTTDNNTSTIDNTLKSNTATGNAGVTSNQQAGDANTGNADGQTTTVNSIHSTVDGDTTGIARFTTNIYGDVLGDITIGPSIANATVDRELNINSNTNVNNNDSITNNLEVKANSGDANVNGNTKAGSAKTGNANAVANVLNLINTIIAANKSFIGTINIYGNLNGDILVSPDFIPQLLADNSVEKSTINMPLSMLVNDDQSIVNNVKLNAASGNANIKDNTGAGTAKTGTATTNLTVLNLTGHKVDAKKSLLVFVNVLGKWVGMIVDAPGATAAAFGSGNVSDTVNVTDNTNINNKSRITNNIDLAAKSGDANVTNNTSAGDATTGNATASANIANISTSEFQLSDWFGVLFINVFGTWIGSFGIDTEAGTVVPLGAALRNAHPDAPDLHMGFVPKDPSQMSASHDIMTKAVAAAATELRPGLDPKDIPKAPAAIPRMATTPHADPFSAIMTVGGFLVAGATGAGSLLNRRREHREVHEVPAGLKITRK